MTIATEPMPVTGVESTAEHLEKAAHHYEKAAHHFRKAAKKEAHEHDHSADHEILEGSAHAVHARIHADEAVKQLAADIADCKHS